MASAYFASTFELTSPDEIEQYVRAGHGGAVEHDFGYFHREVAGDAHLQLQVGRFTGSYSAVMDIDQYAVGTAAGPAGWQERRTSGDMAMEPVLFRPRTPVLSRLADTEFRAVNFDAVALQRTAGLLYGQVDLHLAFDGPRPVDARATARWLAALDIARAQQEAGLLVNDLIRATLFRLLAVSVLENFRLMADRRALHATATRLLTIHRTAAEFFHDFASLPITIDDAAEAAGATVPELVAAFRAHELQHTSPTAYLRAVRLAAAHHDLVAGDPTRDDTVAEISRRWGFASPSRFSAYYRAAYGFNPKRVLDR